MHFENSDDDFQGSPSTARKPIDGKQQKEESQHHEDELDLIEKAFIYPEGCSKNDRSIRRKALRLEEHDGEIYYKKRGGIVVSFCAYAAILQILKYVSMQVRLITSLDERRKILISYHKHPTSGHMGVRKTLSRITEQFMWPGVTKDMMEMVSSCFKYYF